LASRGCLLGAVCRRVWQLVQGTQMAEACGSCVCVPATTHSSPAPASHSHPPR
jgi:hypothetical protein